jgi:hypothetical protein
MISADGAPGLEGDPQDQGGDREADERVGDLDAEGDRSGGRDDSEGHESVDAGVMAVCGEGGALEPGAAAQPDLGRDLVADEADQSGERKRRLMVE